MKSLKTPIGTILMNNSRENKLIKSFCYKHNISVEFIPPDIPKINGVVEREFVIRREK